MLVRFSVENFLSFNERVDFNLIASSHTTHLDHVVKSVSLPFPHLLRTAVIFGANGSGKSNLIKAMKFARDLIIQPSDPDKKNSFKKFKLDPNCANKSSRFEFEFRQYNQQYAYGFVINDQQIEEEWLFDISNNQEEAIFERYEERFYFYDFEHPRYANLSAEDKQNLELQAKIITPNTLFLSISRQQELPAFSPVYEWFITGFQIIQPDSQDFLPLLTRKENSDLLARFSKILQHFDLRIKSITTEDSSLENNPHISAALKQKIIAEFPYHNPHIEGLFIPEIAGIVARQTKDSQDLIFRKIYLIRQDSAGALVTFDLAEESAGIQKLLHCLPILSNIIHGKVVYAIDEVENSFHLLLLKKIFELFFDNLHRESQLIVTTQSVLLLDIKDLFRQDEIWFVTKDKQGQSLLYSLADANVGEDNLVDRYLKGGFGGIPLINLVTRESV